MEQDSGLTSDQTGTARATWPAEWLRGALELCVLAVIARGSTYGYQISAELTKAGLGRIKGGTLYPLLARLEESELVTVEWRTGGSGPARKYYTLSEKGHAYYGERRKAWLAFSDVIGGTVAAHPAKSNAQPSNAIPAPTPRSTEA
ncbi:MAG: PadR family transcriptional regulator [Ancrocorticia sp.]|nr:PadR family transcriptional regulator [Ancrocorticia sp.]